MTEDLKFDYKGVAQIMPLETISFTVWFNEQERIASFHFVVGYEQVTFFDQHSYSDFLQSLISKSYRFM